MLRRTWRRLQGPTLGVSEGIGPVHPDAAFGSTPHSRGYRGPGWTMMTKSLPADLLTYTGGGGLQFSWDRMGRVQDPEDPRMPLMKVVMGEWKSPAQDSACDRMVGAKFGPIPQSSRLMQLLYNNYLEPISMHRVVGELDQYQKVPNHCTAFFRIGNSTYIGQTSAIVGQVIASQSTVFMESVVINADRNLVDICESAQIMENVCISVDRTTDLHAYSDPMEKINPYQKQDFYEGQVLIGNGVTIEPGCTLESCRIGHNARIGHNSKILKGSEIGPMSQILPGSVVLKGQLIGEAEIWGGAPAKKLGKVSKFDTKKPWTFAGSHRRAVWHQCKEQSADGDQTTHWQTEMEKLDLLMLRHEGELPAAAQAQIRELIEGREPYTHTIARLTQAWTPCNRVEQTVNDMTSPIPMIKPTRNHNEDADSDYAGTIFNWKHYWTSENKF